MRSEQQDPPRTCDFCNSVEGQPRLVGGYIVQLTPLTYENETKLACQGCRIKYRNIQVVKEKERRKQEKNIVTKLMKLFRVHD